MWCMSTAEGTSNQATEPDAVIWDQTAGCVDSFVLQCSVTNHVLLLGCGFVLCWLQFLLAWLSMI